MIAKRTGTAAALAVGLLLILAAPALAFPGEVLWHDEWFHSGVYGDDVGHALKLDASGDPIIAATLMTGASTQEILGLSYLPTGIWRWETHWSGSAGTMDYVRDLALDGGGDPFMVGTTDSVGTGPDYVLLRYLNDGSVAGVNYYDGPANGDDEGLAVVCDAAGNSYVTGMSQAADGDMDVATLKIDSAGVQSWVKRFNSRWDRFDGGYALALRGNALYVAGVSRRPHHADDIVLIRYNSTTGARMWVRYLDDPLHRSEQVSDVVATSTSVYVCGSGKFTPIKPGDALIARYTSAGKREWVKYFAGSSSGFYEGFNDLQRSPNGNLVVTGCASRKGSGQDMITAAYRTTGSLRWAKLLYAPGKGSDVGQAVDIDGSGRIYATGTVGGPALTSDVYTVCYTASGGTAWNTPFNGASSGDDVPYDIEVSSNYVWVTGTSFVAANGNDLLTIKYQK